MSNNESSKRLGYFFIYTKNSARPRPDFIYTKSCQELFDNTDTEERCDKKSQISKYERAVAKDEKIVLTR